MTRDEILAMAPGRELDALVAEKVMGFTGIRFGRNDPSAVWIETGGRRKFQPTIDISDAWEVIDRTMEEGFESFEAGRYRVVGTGQFVAKAIKKGTFFRVEANSMPEAICKSALLAVLEESQ